MHVPRQAEPPPLIVKYRRRFRYLMGRMGAHAGAAGRPAQQDQPGEIISTIQAAEGGGSA
ncbi:hypothetical protein IBTHAUMO2_650005 [Nitrosopumilaceae archaeon]|nr:hypothetical protein IBTHAUMO2_650005 [Nitrosopumilaceae archaeon]